MEVVPGIYLLQLPIPFAIPGEPTQMVGKTNVYLVRGKEGWLLVDVGLGAPETLETLERGTQQLGIGIEDVHQIIATHFHHDHLGLAGKVKERSGADVALHENDVPFIDLLGRRGRQTLQESREWFRQYGAPEAELPVFADWGGLTSPDTVLSGGERISTGFFDFEVLWTPGHSPGHVCLYEREKRLLFSGDHILEDITPEVGSSPMQHANPLADYLRCLETSRDLEVDLVLPGHGSPFAHYEKRVSELIEHHQERMKSILEILGRGPRTMYEVSSRLVWIPQVGGVPWERLDPQNRRMAFLETWAHLTMLESEGKVRQLSEDGRIVFSRN